MDKINESAKNIITDNNFLFTAFENRLVMRLVHIFEKHKIPMNKNIIRKNLEENLINHLTESNSEIINKYTKLLSNYESIITSYVESNTKKEIIKESTMSFISRIAEKNKTFIIGLLSGLFGIGITLALIPIINLVIHNLTGNVNISATISLFACITLILLSIVLTIIGGLIPSKKASKQDPVIALRTE